MANMQRSLRRESQGVFAEISYFVGGDRLFTAYVFTFADHPMPEQAGSTSGVIRLVFKAGGHYAVVLIDNTNAFGRFGFENWDYVEAILFHENGK